jgi:CzcA family heavy metal efflux pump
VKPLPSGLQSAIVQASIRFRGVVIALAVLLLGYGIYAVEQAKYDVFPEFAPPQVAIQSEAPGLAPQQVEVLVTRPIEIAISGLPGVQTVRSTSIQGLSVITVYFDPASDIYLDRQFVSEQLVTAAGQLPVGVSAPTITPLTSSTATVLVAGLTSQTRSLMDLRTLADWTVRLRLLAVPGVANVSVFGSDVRSLQVQVHPDQLIRFGLGMNDIIAAAQRATGVRGGGFVETANQRIVFQSEGQSLTPADIGHTVVATENGVSVTLANVADVVEAPEPAIGAATINGKPGVILNVDEQYGANTVDVTRGVEAALAQLRPLLERDGVVLHPGLFRPASFIDTAIASLRSSLIIGGILVIAVLFVFLFDLRSAAISVLAIPLSLLAAVVVLVHSGVTLNTMTLGGLAIALGVVVDDAVVDVENIIRRLRENRQLPEPDPVARVVLDASIEIRTAVVYATFAVLLVVVPIIGLGGLGGRFFGPLATAYALAVLASLVVTLTVVPALATVLLVPGRIHREEPPLMRWTKRAYVRLLGGIVRWSRMAILCAVLLTAVGAAMLPFFGGDFLPELREGHFIVHMALVPSTSLQESVRVGARVSEAIAKVPGVRSVAQRVGRAELGIDTAGPHESEFEVDLKPGLSGDDMEQVEANIRSALATVVGANFSVNSFLSERIEESLSGVTAPVVVNIFGNDLNQLDATAQQVARVLGAVPGAADVQVQSPPGLQQLTIQLRKPDLERWGFDSVQVLDLVRTAYQGDIVGQTYEGEQAFDVMTILDRTSRDNIAAVADLPLRSPSGVYVLLKQIADVYETSGRYQVVHQGAQRVQTVTASVIGTDISSFVDAAQKAITAGVQLPQGTYIDFAGTAEAEAQSQRALLINALIATIGIVLLLSVVTRNTRNLLLVLTNLPFAMVGSVLAVFAMGGVLDLGSTVGFVTLFGISLRNSILMISHYEHLVQEDGALWGRETAIRGAADRLTPILMTSMVTALALLPLAIGMDDPGREIEGPMALVILGGLLTSLALNLLVLPMLALRFGRFERTGDGLEFVPFHS